MSARPTTDPMQVRIEGPSPALAVAFDLARRIAARPCASESSAVPFSVSGSSAARGMRSSFWKASTVPPASSRRQPSGRVRQ